MIPGNPQEKPLAGLRVLVTRPRLQAADLVKQLEAAGAVAIALPTIEICDPPDWQPADRAIERLRDYGWLLLTSTNGVIRFVRRLAGHGLNPAEACAHLETVCVGPKTAAAARTAGLESRTVPKEYAGEGIIELFSGRLLDQERFLFPRALQARELLPETLRRQGAVVDVVPVYETRFPAASADRLTQLLATDGIDLITLTSASTATNLARACPAGLKEKLAAIPAVCIGPITAAAAREAGLRVTATAADYTTEGLLAILHNPLSPAL